MLLSMVFPTLKRNFQRNEAFHDECKEFLTDVIDIDYTEAVPQGKLTCEDGCTTPREANSGLVFECGASFSQLRNSSMP
jgi:hypothetical protein